MSFSKHDLSSCTRGLSSPSFSFEVLGKKYLRSMVKSWILPALLFCESVHSQPTSPGINIKAWQLTRALSSPCAFTPLTCLPRTEGALLNTCHQGRRSSPTLITKDTPVSKEAPCVIQDGIILWGPQIPQSPCKHQLPISLKLRCSRLSFPGS